MIKKSDFEKRKIDKRGNARQRGNDTPLLINLVRSVFKVDSKAGACTEMIGTRTYRVQKLWQENIIAAEK